MMSTACRREEAKEIPSGVFSLPLTLFKDKLVCRVSFSGAQKIMFTVM